MSGSRRHLHEASSRRADCGSHSWGAGLRIAGVSALAVVLGAAAPVKTTCSVSGLAETEATLELTRVGGRIDGFSYYMWRPVGLSWHECAVTADRRKGPAYASELDPSRWGETGAGTRVAITSGAAAGARVIRFAPRPNGVRMTFLGASHCGTFMLPEAVEFRWTVWGCQGQAIGWPRD